MTKRSLPSGLLLCLFLLSSVIPALAQTEREDPLARMEREGWTARQEGVLQRQSKPGEVETFVYGVDGFTWKLQDLRSQLQVLRRAYEANPTPELRRALASHRQVIASTRRMIERARVAEAGGKQTVGQGGCNLSFAFDAEAAGKVNVQGTWAAASAEFKASQICVEEEGEVYAYATASTTVSGGPSTMIVADGPRTGADVSASADAYRNGGPSCESYAYASVTSNSLSPSSYSKSKFNQSCPAASTPSTLQVTLTSDHDDSEVVVPEGECRTVKWTVSITGGTPFYTANIYRDGVFQRTGTSYSEQFCFDEDYEAHYWEYGSNPTVTISVQVTDSGSQSATASRETSFYYRWWIYQ